MNFLLIPNPLRDEGLIQTKKVAEILKNNSGKIFVNKNIADRYALPDYIEQISEDDVFSGIDMIITLGGDGTILRAAKAASKNNIPILSVNVGNCGFMTTLEKNEIELISNVFDSFEYEERMMIYVKVEREGTIIFEGEALNDAVISMGVRPHAIKLEVMSDGILVSKLLGNGVVISTPTGSTAYSLSAGGPIIEPVAENIIVTPICAHALYAKSFVFSSDREISVKAENAYLSVDGCNPFELKSDDLVTIRKSKYKTKLVKLGKKTFFDILYEKLN